MTEKMNMKFEEGLLKILQPSQILKQEAMALHTTFRIGGPADYFLLPSSVEEVASVIALAKETDMPILCLGNGSNLLVRDGGIRGSVLHFGKEMSDIRQEGNTLIVGAGCMLKDIAAAAAEAKLAGFEYFVGIPGSIGGAVFMNAGAYGGEIESVVSAVTAVCPNGQIRRYTREELEFGYRHSTFQENGCAICEVEITLTDGEEAVIQEKLDDLTERRESRQPLDMPSAGSTFKRPVGYFAGTLIDQTGLKGLRVGGAEVSKKHAGFVVNAGGATAKDVVGLIQEVQRRVYEAHGVRLEPEVKMIGEE